MSDRLRIERFAGTASEWDDFGRSQAGWTAFHRHAWRGVVERVHSHECPFLCARNAEGLIVGILPLVRLKSALFGHFLVSMPFVSYGGPLGSDDAVQALANAAAAIGIADGVDLLELRSARALPLGLPVTHRKITVVLPLEGGPAAVFARLKSKLRNQVRRPAKEGVVYRFGAPCVDDFHTVFARHMRDLGTPAQPRAFFRAIADAFGEDAWFGCAYVGDRPIACGAGFRWANEFEITWASALREHSSLSANTGLYWEFIERAARQGLTRFNFGRCSPGSAAHKFKLQWGAEDEPLWWYHGLGSRRDATPDRESRKYAFATRLWRQLPVPVATALGPRLVRSIP